MSTVDTVSVVGSASTDKTASAVGTASAANQSPSVQMLRHVRINLALHHLRSARVESFTRPLLLLHGLGERTPNEVPSVVAGWPGPIFGLDFCGHGQSSSPRGGGYTSEVLMGDVDAALAVLGPCTIVGRGLGGYIGLLAAGGRADLVRGLVITDGSGMVGGGVRPGSMVVDAPGRGASATATPDPFALLELATDVRPPDYAISFLRLALAGSSLDVPVYVAAVSRPPWLAALCDEVGVEVASVKKSLDRLATFS